jgi:C4-dicarboxylate-specific signal transduction histidine kinase
MTVTTAAGTTFASVRDIWRHLTQAQRRTLVENCSNRSTTKPGGLAQGAIVNSGVTIQTRLTERLPDVQVDCIQLQQVVLNLILNAIEAMSSVQKGARELSISTE